ncbi:PREDICTED: F-box protein PP2-B13-like isoform X2 [Ipomoea nil]|uniref:F-box protein PP2-B13-like isoform X1 n=1 Tax=Ipomoea nil TaxID=35883 RepID=UPI000901C30C|nr:PREDICTED: F-box protein PP2-B13-like isoform X1 [Ipomoea nil]XP_019157052.1 PREDICTED: F-box protein PP2-B13-like isoform X2 [Ipomoea nil]
MADYYYERELDMLPEDCISSILSRTSPLDAFHLSLVSSTFRSAAGADSVWERFLPSDYAQIVAKSTVPLKFSSKKDLFLQLCNSILIDHGNKSFALEKSTGLKSYMLSARELSIRYGHASDHWAWKYIPESRFAEVAELKTICRLEIQGKIRTETLSPNTKYGAYMVMKMTDGAFGLDAIPCEMSVAVGNDDDQLETTAGTAYLRKPAEVAAKQWLEYALYRNRKEKLKSRVNGGGEERQLRERGDGWMEIEVGEFFAGEENEGEVTMRFTEVNGCHVKGGLVIEGIEIRPKH